MPQIIKLLHGFSCKRRECIKLFPWAPGAQKVDVSHPKKGKDKNSDQSRLFNKKCSGAYEVDDGIICQKIHDFQKQH